MKAKIIATGKVVEVFPVDGTKHTYVDSDCHYYADKSLEFIPEIDWEKRRFELAKAALPEAMRMRTEYRTPEDIANIAIAYADALLSKLKEE